MSSIAVPPLENGDRLTRREFGRRYGAITGVKRAELIEGDIHISFPVRFRQHAKPQAQLLTWLGYYFAGTPSPASLGGWAVDH